MPLVEIIRPCIAQGRRAKPGERLELSDVEVRLLLGLRRAEIVETPLPVVIDDPAPAKVSTKRPRRKPKSEGASAPSATVPTAAVEEPSSDAPAAAE